MKKFTIGFISILIVLCMLMAQTVLAANGPVGIEAMNRKNPDGTNTYTIEGKEVTHEEYWELTRNRALIDVKWYTLEDKEKYFSDLLGSTAWVTKNPDGTTTWTVDEKEVTKDEYNAFITDRLFTGSGRWYTPEEYETLLQQFDKNLLESMINEALLRGDECVKVSLNGTDRYFVDGVEVTQVVYNYRLEHSFIFNGRRVNREEYEVLTGIDTWASGIIYNSVQMSWDEYYTLTGKPDLRANANSFSLAGRDLSKVDLLSLYRPDVSFRVAEDYPWYNHQQKMYVGDNYSLGSLRSSKTLVDEIFVVDKIGMVPYKLVYEVGTVLNFSYYTESTSAEVNPVWRLLDEWDSYWVDLLDYGMLVVVDTSLFASASRIAYGHEVILTEDMVGKKLGLWPVGESFDNAHMVTIELEVVPAGTLKSTSTPPTNTPTNQGTTVTFNNQPLQFDLPIINKDGRTYYPLIRFSNKCLTLEIKYVIL